MEHLSGFVELLLIHLVWISLIKFGGTYDDIIFLGGLIKLRRNKGKRRNKFKLKKSRTGKNVQYILKRKEEILFKNEKDLLNQNIKNMRRGVEGR